MWTLNFPFINFGNRTQGTLTHGSPIIFLKAVQNCFTRVRLESNHVCLRLPNSNYTLLNRTVEGVKGAKTSAVVTRLEVSRLGHNATTGRRVFKFTQLTSMTNLGLPMSNGALDGGPDQLKTRAHWGERCEENRLLTASLPAGEVANCAGRTDDQRAASSRAVAVIGAGAGGLVAARELLREGHNVVVFEQFEEVGGVWVYNPRVESDLLGVDPNRSRVFSSLYKSLRTNLPREVMGFTDYPFVARSGEGRDARCFPSHSEVLHYLTDFAHDHKLNQYVLFGAEVQYVGPQWTKGTDIQWVVKFRRKRSVKPPETKDAPTLDGGPSQKGTETRVFDAVVLCNGHFEQSRIVHIPGLESWPGVQIHSHNYRGPEPFQDKVVIVIGGASSGEDISKEVGTLAKEIHLCSRSWTSSDFSTEWEGPRRNMWRHPMVGRTLADGTVEFQDGSSVVADFVIHCTGYCYTFPFLDAKDCITVDQNRVGPLYKHVFPPALAPSLSFIGLPFKVIPFVCMEVQARWIAKVLSGKLSLPAKDEMMEDVEKLYERMEAGQIPKHHTHSLAPDQRLYVDWVAQQGGGEAIESWRYDMYSSAAVVRKADPYGYRENWKSQELVDIAMAAFEKLKVPVA